MKRILLATLLGLGCLLLGARALLLAPLVLLVAHFAHPGAGILTLFVAATSPVFYARGAGWLEPTAPTPELRTFEWTIVELGRGLFPWSALLPFALAGMTLLPRPSSVDAPERERQATIRVVLSGGMVLWYGASQLLSSRLVLSVGASLAATVLGSWLWDVVTGTRVPGRVRLGIAVLTALWGLEFLRFPATRWLTFAPEATPAELAALADIERSAPLPLRAAVALSVLTSLLGCSCMPWRVPERIARRFRLPPHRHFRVLARARGAAPFLGILLAAIVLRGGYHPRAVAERPRESPSPAAGGTHRLEQSR